MSKWNMSNLTEIPVLLHPKVRNTIQDQRKMYKTLKRIPHHSLCCQMNKLLCKKIPILVLQNENCNNAYVLWLQFWIYTWLPSYLMQSSIGQELLFFSPCIESKSWNCLGTLYKISLITKLHRKNTK